MEEIKQSVLNLIVSSYPTGIKEQPRSLKWSTRYSYRTRRNTKTPIQPKHLVPDTIIQEALSACNGNFDLFKNQMKNNQLFLKQMDINTNNLIKNYFEEIVAAKNFKEKLSVETQKIDAAKRLLKIKKDEVAANNKIAIKKAKEKAAERLKRAAEVKSQALLVAAKKKAAMIKELGLSDAQFRVLKKLIP